jgi:hypothetical protein
MTRLQEAQEWAGRLDDSPWFFFGTDGKFTTIWPTLNEWSRDGFWCMQSIDTRLLALAFAATAPAELR